MDIDRFDTHDTDPPKVLTTQHTVAVEVKLFVNVDGEGQDADAMQHDARRNAEVAVRLAMVDAVTSGEALAFVHDYEVTGSEIAGT